MPKTKSISIKDGLASEISRGRDIYVGPFETKQVAETLEITDVFGKQVTIKKNDHVAGATVEGNFRTGGYVITIGPDYLYVKLGARTFPIAFNNVDPMKNFQFIAHQSITKETKQVTKSEPVPETVPEPVTKNKSVKKSKKDVITEFEKQAIETIKLTLPKNYAKLTDGTVKSFRSPSDLRVFLQRPKNKDLIVESSYKL